MDAFYYRLLSHVVDRYEQLLIAVELSVTKIEQRSICRPSKKMLYHVDLLSRQIIVMRRHFGYTQEIVNFLTRVNEGKPDVKYLKIGMVTSIS